MYQVGEDLALSEEPAMLRIVVPGLVDQLDGDALLEVPVSAFGQVDLTHAATTKLADDAICPDAIGHSCRGGQPRRNGPQVLSKGIHRPRRRIGGQARATRRVRCGSFTPTITRSDDNS